MPRKGAGRRKEDDEHLTSHVLLTAMTSFIGLSSTLTSLIFLILRNADLVREVWRWVSKEK